MPPAEPGAALRLAEFSCLVGYHLAAGFSPAPPSVAAPPPPPWCTLADPPLADPPVASPSSSAPPDLTCSSGTASTLSSCLFTCKRKSPRDNVLLLCVRTTLNLRHSATSTRPLRCQGDQNSGANQDWYLSMPRTKEQGGDWSLAESSLPASGGTPASPLCPPLRTPNRARPP